MWNLMWLEARSCCLNCRGAVRNDQMLIWLMRLEACSCGLNCRSAVCNDQILIWSMRLEACSCGVNCRNATRNANILFWMWLPIARLVVCSTQVDASKYLMLTNETNLEKAMRPKSKRVYVYPAMTNRARSQHTLNFGNYLANTRKYKHVRSLSVIP